MSDNGKTHYADDETLAYISKLEAENKSLQDELAEAKVQIGTLCMDYRMKCDNETNAINLRVTRLVEALTPFAKHPPFHAPECWPVTVVDRQGPDALPISGVTAGDFKVAAKALSATPQDDQAWLREQKANVLVGIAERFPEETANGLRYLAAELLSQQSKGGE